VLENDLFDDNDMCLRELEEETRNVFVELIDEHKE